MSIADLSKPRKYTLVQFEGEEDVNLWETLTDFKKGGNSVCEVKLGSSNGGSHMEFAGNLQFDKELDYKDRLFAEATLSRMPRKKFRGFNGVQIELKTDGNPYRLQFIHYLYFNTESYYVSPRQVDIVDKSRQWTVLEIPLKNFCNMQGAPGSQMTLMNDLEMTYTILGMTLGIYSPHQRQGPFAVSLRSVALIYRPDMEGLRYDLPIMIKRMEDYSTTKYVDTGHSLIDVREFKARMDRSNVTYPEDVPLKK